jgi:hypothetical protein
MNEQLSRLTPFSQQVAPGLAWRSRYSPNKKGGSDEFLNSPGCFIQFNKWLGHRLLGSPDFSALFDRRPPASPDPRWLLPSEYFASLL